ncbi:MAG: hypothetical protein FK730_14480 [Asgard group archaeon]|nr:hypothetical protein [Asgard group archaeon]
MLNRKKKVFFSLALIVLVLIAITLSFITTEMKQYNTNKKLTTLDYDNTISFPSNGNLDLVGQYDENLGSPDEMFIDSNYLYVSCDYDGLTKFDISDPLHPVFLGATGFVGSFSIDFCIQEDIAFLLYQNYLKILNISDVSNPDELVIINNLLLCNKVKIHGDFLVINDLIVGLKFYNISNPLNPELLNTLPKASINGYDFEIREYHLYLTTETRSSLFIYDISDIFNLTYLGSYVPPFYSQSEKLLVANSLAYIVTQQELLIFNITNSFSPTLITTYLLSEVGSNRKAILMENALYITNHLSLLVLDITNPFLPAITTIIDEIWHLNNLIIKDNFLFISMRYNFEIIVYNIIDENNPIEFTRYKFGGVSYDVCGNSNLVYIANGINGTQIIDVSNPQNPNLIGSYFDNDTTSLLEISGSILYVVSFDSFNFDYNCCLKIIDVSNPTKPTLLSEYQSDHPNAHYCDLEIYNEKIILALGEGGLEIIDISDNLHPTLIDSYSDMLINRIEVRNNYVYAAVAEFDVDFVIFDITNPSNIHLLSSLQLEIGQSSEELAIENNKAYLFCNDPSLSRIIKIIIIINVENPANPIVQSITQVDLEYIFGIDAMNDRLYLACDFGLVVLKKTSRNDLVYVDQSHDPVYTIDLFVHKGFVYVASGWGGLIIYTSFNPIAKLTEILILVSFITIPIIIAIIIIIVRKRK